MSQTTWICCWCSHNSAASGVWFFVTGPPAEPANSWSHGGRRCNQWDQEEDTYIQSEQSQYYHHCLCINQCWITSLFCFPVQLGANGYTFAIDPNGYVLLHPNLRPKVCPTTSPSSSALMSLRASDPRTKFGCFSSWLALTLPAPLSCFLSLFRSLTSGSPSLWTFWMQSWKTATRRR